MREYSSREPLEWAVNREWVGGETAKKEKGEGWEGGWVFSRVWVEVLNMDSVPVQSKVNRSGVWEVLGLSVVAVGVWGFGL